MVNLTRLGEGVWDLLPDPDPTGSREQKGEPVVTSTLPDPEAPKPTSSSFQAKWDEYLQPPEITTRQKVGHVFSSLFLFATPLIALMGFVMEKIIRYLLLPAILEHDSKKMVFFSDFPSNLECRSRTVVTPDGCALEVIHFKCKNATPQTPTLLFFNPNAALAQDHAKSWFYNLNNFRKTRVNTFNCNCVFFSYRQTGGSKGEFRSSKDLVVDGYSVVQWLREEMGVPPQRIHFFGSSLGGAVAAQVQALDPKLTGKHINVRSFSSLKDVLKAYVGSFVGRLAHAILCRQNYDIDALPSFQKLKGHRLVIYHPEDQIIPRSAQLGYGLSSQLGSSALIVTSLKGGADKYESSIPSDPDHHNNHLNTFFTYWTNRHRNQNIVEKRNIVESIIGFLFREKINEVSLSKIGWAAG